MRALNRLSMLGLVLLAGSVLMAASPAIDNVPRVMKGGAQIYNGLVVTGGIVTDAGTTTFRGDAGVTNNLFVGGDAGVNGNLTTKGLQVGVASATATRILQATATVDFVTATTTCTESSAITITGALAGDACFPIVPSSGGSTNASYTCYVSASDACKVRHCAAGSADDPVSATFGCVVFSIQ